jgi:hypothetical protein
MNCWKTVNFSRDYGPQRLFILSSLTMLLTFIFIYVPAQYLFAAASLSDKHFLLFLAALLAIYPLHKLLHFLPMIHQRKKIKKELLFKYSIIPVFYVKVNEPMPKWLFLTALLTPFVVINCAILIACYSFGQYVHYFTILLAFHMGLCLHDLICAKNVVSAPNQSYIEESEDGIEILLHTHS